jgi:hypothetical protein
MTACVRECARFLAALDVNGHGEVDGLDGPGARLNARRTALVAAIGALVVEQAALEPSDDRSFDALLTAGRRALAAGELRLARRLADAAVALRARAPEAWRLRGQALDAQGREKDAIAAFERYQTMAPGAGSAQVARRLARLREKRAALVEADAIVPEARLDDHPPSERGEVFAVAVERRLKERGGPADPETRRLVAAYETYRRISVESGVGGDPAVGRSEPIGVASFRSLLKGRNVCVVANGEEIAASGLGEEIDSYDLVVRLDSFQPHRAGTGERVDLHAVSHRCDGQAAWRRRAEVRLVFAPTEREWRAAMRDRLVPGAQAYAGDESLSGPLRDPALIGERRWAANASTGFTVVRLLDLLDVSPRIDLFGLGLAGQLRPEERQWVRAHARRSEGLRIALR